MHRACREVGEGGHVSSPEPDLLEAIELVVRSVLSEYNAPMLARVVEITDTLKKNTRANIQPLFRFPRTDSDTFERTYLDPPIIHNAVVLVPASAASDSAIKLAVGDIGLWVPSMFSLDDFLDTGTSGLIEPQDTRQQAIQDGFFLPLRTNRAVHAEAYGADRAILGTDVRVGTPGSTESLAFKASVQTAINKIWYEFDLVDTALAVAGSGSLVYTVSAPGAAGLIDGTSHLKGS